MIRPTAILTIAVREAVMHREVAKTVRRDFDTYRLLRKAIPDLLEEAIDDEVHVARSRRGQCGEWFEVWVPGPKGPKLVKEGWQ